jgi:hypothetical protein
MTIGRFRLLIASNGAVEYKFALYDMKLVGCFAVSATDGYFLLGCILEFLQCTIDCQTLVTVGKRCPYADHI